MRPSGRLKSRISWLALFAVASIIIAGGEPAFAQTIRNPTGASNNCGEPTDPERTRQILPAGRFEPDAVSGVPSNLRAPGPHSPVVSSSVPVRQSTALDGFFQFLRRFGIIVPKGPRS